MNALLKLDVDLSNRLRLSPKNKILWSIFAVLAHSGDSWFWLAGLIIIWLISTGAWCYGSGLTSASMVILAVFILAIKFIVRRQRPPGEWGAIYRNTDPHSFPSGHASRVALLAALGFGLGSMGLGILLSIWAILVCMARVSMGVHYLSDVIVGALIGAIVGIVILGIQTLVVEKFSFFFC